MNYHVIVSEGLVGLEKTDLSKKCSVFPLGVFQNPLDVARDHPESRGLLVLLSHRIDGRVMDLMPDLGVISNYAVGFDNIDIPAATERGITVTNTPDVLTEATADLTWALLLAASRRIVEADRFVREGKFRGWKPDLLLGHDITGKTLGIIGMGRIGKAVARRARGFDMRIIYHDTSVGHEVDRKLDARGVEFDELLQSADIVSLHVPLNEKTRGMIGEKELGMMKSAAILINTSRGPVLDERALTASLKKKNIAAAGLDVFESEPEIFPGLLELDNVVLSPHVGSAGRETREMMTEVAVRNLLSVLEGGEPAHRVNEPRRNT